MSKNWIIFDECRPQAAANENYVSMTKDGWISFNRPAFDAMGCPEAIEMMYDPDEDLIGLKASTLRMPHTFPVRPKGDTGHHRIFATRFVRRHDLRFDGTVRFPDTRVEDGVFIMSLRNLQLVKRKSPQNSRRR